MKIGQTTVFLLTAALAGMALADRRTSLDDAVSEARERYPGRVISAETRREDGRESHRIRILTDEGRVKRFEIDAESGRFERRNRR
jgi:uncharacterized membrane protein YkoI